MKTVGKVIVLNCSPRKNSNTASLLKEAARGAQDSGAVINYYNLADINFKGCVSCFACKIKGSTTNGLCAYKDDLRPILAEILEADAVFIGSPIYYSYPTGMFRNLLERMLFAAGSYMIGEETILHKTVPIGIIYTMNVTEDGAKLYNYPEIMAPNEEYLKYIFGYAESYWAYDTYQFSDYSKYNCDMFDEPHKAHVRYTQFPIDMQNVYELGKKLTVMPR